MPLWIAIACLPATATEEETEPRADTVRRDQTLPEPVRSAEALLNATRLCLKRVDFNARIRLIGVREGRLGYPR